MRNPRNETLAHRQSARPGGSGDTPERRCVLTGRLGSRDALIRLAVSPAGDVLPDALARAPGRGAWIGVTRDELAAAIADGKLKGALARAFRTGQLHIPDDLPVLLARALQRALTDRLGLELRSGHLILGFDRIASDARMGKVAALYHAADAGEDGSRKLDQALRVGRDAEGSGERGDILPLDRDALSVALGRDNVVHLALADRASAQRVMVPLRRLQTYLAAAPAVGTNATGVAGETARDAAATN